MTDHRGPLWTMWVTDAKAALRAGFPELFASPAEAWLAPMESTREMFEAGIKAFQDPENRHGAVLDAVYEAYRDTYLAHINPKD